MVFDLENPLWKMLLDSVVDGVYFVDSERRICYWNLAAEKITGFRSFEVTGRPCSDNLLTHVDENGTQLCEGLCPLAECMRDGSIIEKEIFLRHREGYRIPVRIR